MKKKTIKVAIVGILFVSALCACSLAMSLEEGNSPEPELTYQDFYDLGVRYLFEGNYQEAIIALTAAIEINPKQAPAYVGRGDAYVLSGETEENLTAAKADYEKAIELDESNAEAYLGLADVYIRQRDYEKALEILRQGLEQAGNHQDIADKIAEIEDGNITDSSGDIRRETYYGSASELVFWLDYTYDVQSRPSSVTSYNAAGEQIGHLELTYTVDGQPLDSFTVNVSVSYNGITTGGTLERLHFEYDTQGRPTRMHRYNLEGEPVAYEEYLYDAQGNKIRTDYYSSVDETFHTYDLMEYNSQGYMVKTSHYDKHEMLVIYYTYEYDAEGTETRFNTCDKDGQLMSYSLSIHNAEGKLTAVEHYDGDGNLISATAYD